MVYYNDTKCFLQIVYKLLQFQNDTCTVKRRPVKVFDIQHQANSSGSVSVSEMATSVDITSSDNANKHQPNFSLVKLFMKQKSISTEGKIFHFKTEKEVISCLIVDKNSLYV